MLKNYKKLDYQSLKDEEKEEKIVFHLLSDFIKEETLEKLKTLEKELSAIYPTTIQTHILSDEIFKCFLSLAGKYLNYYRLFIPQLLNNIDTALYLDVDMLVCADVRALWTLNLEGKSTAIVRDWGLSAPLPRKSLHGKADFNFGDFYFNSGFMFLNVKTFREKNLFEKCLDYLNNYETFLWDQDALNAVIRENDALMMPFAFNCIAVAYIERAKTGQFLSRSSFEEMCFWTENPVILHFAGIVKPWENPFIVQNEKGEYIGLRYIEAAKKSFCFANDITKNLILYAKKIYLSRIVFQYSKNIFGLFKIPFVITKIKICDFQKEEILDYLKNYDNDHLFAGFSENGKDHLIKEFYAKYERAKKTKSFLYLLKLPLAILKVKRAAKNKS